MHRTLKPLALTSVIFCGAIFGFFYAWVCSTMWGLDAADPRIAIAAMQAMNASVRNAVFAPAFFGTPVVLALTAIVARYSGARKATICFALAAVVYATGGLLLTLFVNVPMNMSLASRTVPPDMAAAAAIWAAYSPEWQFFNQLRTVASGLALLLAAIGLAATAGHRR
ncbi:MAG: anthrone oxygenase family protein [Albidovulum sp.]